MSWINPAGGLYYHLRTLRYRSKLWPSYLDATSRWLDGWGLESQKLILVGPSGGYSLPTRWLQRFESIRAIDIDPLAKHFFRMNHGALPVSWSDANCFPFRASGIDLTGLESLISKHPDHAVLFCNVLGQLFTFADTERQLGTIPSSLLKLRSVLRGREWASYHERFSGSVRPEIVEHEVLHLSDAQIHEGLYHGCALSELVPHYTSNMAVGLSCSYFEWQRVPKYWHLMEACVGGSLPQACAVDLQVHASRK